MTFVSRFYYHATVAEYELKKGLKPPKIKVTVTENAKLAASPSVAQAAVPDGALYEINQDNYEAIIKEATDSSEDTITLMLTEDVTDKATVFSGIEGKTTILTSTDDGGDGYVIRMGEELEGNVILDRIKLRREDYSCLYANGHIFETTENFVGTINELYGGGSEGNDVSGDTELVIRGGHIKYMYGGGLDSAVEGSVHIVIDGEDADIENLYGGGRAKQTRSGIIDGDVTIDFRKGRTRGQFGGGTNEYSRYTDDRTPAMVTGTVTVNMGYEGAETDTGWPGVAMFVHAGSEYSTVGNVRMNISDGVTIQSNYGNRNIYGCGYGDTVLGTVEINVSGSPNVAEGSLYGGGDYFPGYEIPIRIENRDNEEYALHIVYDVPSGLSSGSGAGIHAGSDDSLPTEINGSVLVEIKNGDLDFVVLDNENFGDSACTVNGDAEAVIYGGKVAQFQGNAKQYEENLEGCQSKAVLKDGETGIGYFYYFDSVHVTDGAKADVDSEKFSQFGSIQKPFYNVRNLTVDGGASLTTRNSDTNLYGDVAVDDGIWHSKGYTYLYEAIKLKDAKLLFDNYYQIGYAHKDDENPAGTVRFKSEDSVFYAMYTSYLNRIYGDVQVKGGEQALMSRTVIAGNANYDNAEIMLPAVWEGENYPDGDIPLNIDGTASGSAKVGIIESVRPVTLAAADKETVDASEFSPVPTEAKLGDRYITGFAPHGTGDSSEQDVPPEATFTLADPDAVEQGYYLKRVTDPEAPSEYYMWEFAQREMPAPEPEPDPEPEPEPEPGTPSEPDEPDEPDTPATPSEPEQPDKPDTPDEPDNPATPSEPDSGDGGGTHGGHSGGGGGGGSHSAAHTSDGSENGPGAPTEPDETGNEPAPVPDTGGNSKIGAIAGGLPKTGEPFGPGVYSFMALMSLVGIATVGNPRKKHAGKREQ